ncbi:MAG TPA: hypothetical protein VK646_13410 [Actinomycetota bacterium]|nr:hypothetical protein [Actinomycetota bacterium]
MERIKRHLGTIVVAFVTATVAAGGTAAVAAAVNAQRLNGYTANQLIRVSSKRTTGGVNPLTTATVTSTSIKTPKKGYLVIDASSAIDDSLGAVDGTLSCWLTLDGTKLSTTSRSVSISPGNALYDQDCATNVAWPVGPGTHTIGLVADNPDGTAATFGPATLNALYEPFGANGAPPAPLPAS